MKDGARVERPVARDPFVAARMVRQRRRDTVPEIDLRRALFARGMRYRLHWKVPGAERRTIDVAFVGIKVAVFVDGCFWHSCPEHATKPRANESWWAQKLARNTERDRETDAILTGQGWVVIRVWEHETAATAAERIEQAIQSRASS